MLAAALIASLRSCARNRSPRPCRARLAIRAAPCALAQLTLTNEETNVKHSSQSNERGIYLFTASPGSYG